MFGMIYSSYVKAMAAIGSRLPTSGGSGHSIDDDSVPPVPSLPHGEADRLANTFGNRYRGIGVAVGLLGAAIVFCAVLPFGAGLSPHGEHLVGYVKIALMAAMFGLVMYTMKRNPKRQWIQYRRMAEIGRYASLKEALDACKNERSPAAEARLINELRGVLADQVGYNERSHRRYHAIERFSDGLSWIGFGGAFLAAVAHVWWPASWLIFFTAFGPALVGAIHGINGFLRLGDLAEDHGRMATHLSQLRTRLETAQGDALFQVGDSAYQILNDRDAEWAEMAHKLGIKVA